MNPPSAPLDPDLAARFDQELAELRDMWISQLPEDDRPPLDEALKNDPFLTHQVFALVDETLLAHQALAFLFSAAQHLGTAAVEDRRPILAGLLGLSGLGESK